MCLESRILGEPYLEIRGVSKAAKGKKWTKGSKTIRF